jgi:hypothetical protein
MPSRGMRFSVEGSENMRGERYRQNIEVEAGAPVE